MEQMLDFVIENYVWFIIGGIVVMMTIIGYIADKTDFGKESMRNSKKEKISKKEVNEIEDNEEDLMVNNIEQESFAEELVEEMPSEESYSVEENVEPAFDTDEMFNLDEEPINVENIQPSEEIAVSEAEEQEEVLDKKTLKRMQKEEAKRLKEEEKRLKKESKNESVEELASEPEMENFYAEEETETSSDLFEPMEDVELEVPHTDLDMEINQSQENFEEASEPEMENFYEEETVSNEVEEPRVEIEEIPEIELPSIESLDKELDDYEEEDDVWKF